MRRFIKSLFRLLITLAVCLAGGVGVLAAPNVVFLLSDDQRFDTIHALGNDEIQTPNLDKLVARGSTFTHAFCMGSTIGAVCVPSRAMMMTGRSLYRSRKSDDSSTIRTNLALFPEVFRARGYETIGVGKWHNDRESYARAFSAGGSVFFGGMNDHTKMPLFDFDPSGKYPASAQKTVTGFSSQIFADTAIGFLQKQKRDKPFFLYVAFTAPHDPRMPPKAYSDLYPPEKIRLPKNFLTEHPFDNGEMKVRDEALLPWPRTPEAVRKEISDYYGMITHLDAQIGRIIEALEATGQAGNTILVFASDHGLAVGRHGLLGKQNLYDHSVRPPLIVAGPGVPAGKRSDALAYLYDIFPTVCDLAKIPIPAGVEGLSLVPAIQGVGVKPREAVFGVYRDVQRMARDDRWKLIYYPKIGRSQLFDLQTDPDEMADLSARPEWQPKLSEMREKLEKLRREFSDPLRSN